MKLERYSRENLDTSLIRKTDNFEISVYSGEITKICIAENIAKLKLAFPSLELNFYEIFSDRIIANGFSNDRLKDAVNSVIDNCVFPSPTIAQFIAYDKHIKIYSYLDITKMLQYDAKPFETYKSVRLSNKQPKPMYAHINDVEKYKLDLWNK